MTAVLRSGQRRRTPRMDIMWRPNEVGHPRLGLIVPRHGDAGVRRNRVRRRLREIVRREVLRRITAVDLVVRARPPAYRSTYAELARDLEQWAHSLAS